MRWPSREVLKLGCADLEAGNVLTCDVVRSSPERPHSSNHLALSFRQGSFHLIQQTQHISASAQLNQGQRARARSTYQLAPAGVDSVGAQHFL